MLLTVPLLYLRPIGFMIQGVGLYIDRSIPRWQSISLVVAMVLLGVSAAVDIDLFGLVASAILAIAMLPIGVQLIAESNRRPSEKH